MDTIISTDQPEWAHERLAWRIGLTPIHVFGILAAIYRISRRYKTRQSGWDDYAATLVLILDFILFPTLWLRNGDATLEVPAAGLPTATESGGMFESDLPTDLETRIAQVVIGWVAQIVISLLTWSAKASLALTTARLIPTFHFTHKASIAVACLSVIVGLGTVIQICIFCTKVDTTWSHISPYRCKVTALAGVLRSSSEIIIDILLVMIPFVAFFLRLPSWTAPQHPSDTANARNPSPVRIRIRLPPVTRRLIQFSFLASFLSSSVSILTMALLFKIERSTSREMKARVGYTAFVLSQLNASVSLLVCNLLIVVTSLYRFLRTPSRTIEVGKSPVIPNIPNQENSELEPTGVPINDTSGTGMRETRATAEGNVSGNSDSMTGSGGDRDRGSSDAGSRHEKTSSTSSGIELTELFESDFSIA